MKVRGDFARVSSLTATNAVHYLFGSPEGCTVFWWRTNVTPIDNMHARAICYVDCPEAAKNASDWYTLKRSVGQYCKHGVHGGYEQIYTRRVLVSQIRDVVTKAEAYEESAWLKVLDDFL